MYSMFGHLIAQKGQISMPLNHGRDKMHCKDTSTPEKDKISMQVKSVIFSGHFCVVSSDLARCGMTDLTALAFKPRMIASAAACAAFLTGTILSAIVARIFGRIKTR